MAPEKHYPEKVPDQIQTESDHLAKRQQTYRQGLEKTSLPIIEAEPILPSHDPLEDQIVSFSMVDEDLQMVLYSLSQAAGVNFIIDPAVTAEKKTLTLNFENVSAAKVLREIVNTFDLYYEVDGTVVRIKPYQEQVFKLNFIDTDLDASFDVGGDVLGAGETQTASGLTGSVKLSGRRTSKGNAYDVLEQMVKPLISPLGRFSINRMSGSLYVKDTPAVIAAIGRLVHHFTDMLSRQIKIEARIIEVMLSDQYKYGIDWSAIRDLADAPTEMNSAAWSITNGLVLSGQSDDFSLQSTIDALNTFGDVKVVSNPSIRSKHGKPAILSVGTSFSYKKSVQRTTSTTASTTDETVDVEVSTVFDGLLLGVIPFIEDNGKITLLINPIKSDVDQESLTPEEVADGDSISLPQVSIKEISTTIALKDGDVAILGGLIDKRQVTDNRGVPFLSSIPVFGYLFKNELKRQESRELVIILSVHLV
jgi:MSHA type pilus biogenesis protein MshL